MHNKQVTKLTLTVSGIQEDILSCIPDGKKAAILNAALLESARNGSLFGVFFEIFGVQDGHKIKKKVEKMLSGVGIDSNNNQNTFYKETTGVPNSDSLQTSESGIGFGTTLDEQHTGESEVVGNFNFNFEKTGEK